MDQRDTTDVLERWRYDSLTEGEIVKDANDEANKVEGDAKRLLFWYRTLRVLGLLAAAVTTVLAAVEADAWVTTVVAGIALLANGYLELTRLGDQSQASRRAAYLMHEAVRIYREGGEPYRSAADRREKFVDQIEIVRRELRRNKLRTWGETISAPATEGTRGAADT